jgi:hypothetical protein
MKTKVLLIILLALMLSASPVSAQEKVPEELKTLTPRSMFCSQSWTVSSVNTST